ncbi:hypothetical protein QR721_12015 [Aciduricibacillus chroicocephali]|uniref:Uncharacterized protein n=1 Tax=Aciduricibacillus chroicocephali TaxID=3054939 RepID=A0ABY9KU12_9BACI|nr:hypothetical protein QR721_12015 [Bacillaceae bacterium 44XB]
MARKLKRIQEQKEEPVKVQRKKEEVLATAGGFLFAGGYLLFTGTIPETVAGWVKFVGMFILVSAIIYLIAWGVIKSKKKQ